MAEGEITFQPGDVRLEDAGHSASIRPVVLDLNGVMRGKRLPVSALDKVLGGELKLPLTTLLVDIWGRDALASGQVLETGDGDGVLKPTGRGALPINWLETPSALVPLWMYQADGSPYPADPRHALAKTLERYQAAGLTPVCATELEFYLYAPERGTPSPPHVPLQDRTLTSNALYAVQDLDNFEGFLGDVYKACKDMGVPADAAISENGCGQFEINLTHRPDALAAADDAVLLKYIVKGAARKHGLAATFMAKPYGREAGSGFHTHFSVLDRQGMNIFADGTALGSPALRAAVGGLLDGLAASMLVFAPHANSYRRLREGTHAPINLSWGYDNRTGAIRIPSGPDAARRIEHRVAGADANPYLVLAAILGAALDGMQAGADPGEPFVGNAYEATSLRLPATWHAAISRFDADPISRQLFDPFLADMLTACKWQEYETLADLIPSPEYDAYLETV